VTGLKRGFLLQLVLVVLGWSQLLTWLLLMLIFSLSTKETYPPEKKVQ
jgi:hypothetical protein